tara:strand:+ start:456 stop:599 length:144 start_codon:yes stop_codon:yes gene_type:complete
MISYIVYIAITIILVLVSIIAIRALKRGIKAKKNINKNKDYNNYKKK